MDWQIRINAKANLATVTMHGHVTEAALLEVFDAFYGHPDFKPGMHILGDLTDARIDLAAPAMARIIEYLQRHRDKRGTGKEAIVVGSTADYGIGRMIEAYTEDPLPYELRVFLTVEEAHEWMGV